MKVLVIGYYNKGNLGDDAYIDIMGKFFPKSELEFVTVNSVSVINGDLYDAVIVGGGDIINDYFHERIHPFLKDFKGPKIAFSIGIPFPSCITEKYLGHFDHVFVRNYEDLRAIQKVIGSHKVHYIPDITLSYEVEQRHRLYSETISDFSVTRNTNKQCGVFLVGNLIRFPNIVDDIARLIGKMALTYKVILYCFDKHEDVELSNKVREIALDRLGAIINNNERIVVDTGVYNITEMLNIINGLDFAICMKYHAHIFCAITGTPFMSISSTRKTRSLVSQMGLVNYQYEIELDGYGTPIGSDYDTMREICRQSLRNRKLILEQLDTFLVQSRYLLESNQAEQLLIMGTRDLKHEISEFMNETGDFHNGARLLSNHAIGYPDSPYVWGMFEKFKDANEDIKEVVHSSFHYLTDYGTHIRNEIANLFVGVKKLPLYIDIKEYQTYRNAHRGGWYVACEELYKRNQLTPHKTPNGIICDMYVDRTFHWARSYMKFQGIVPYTSPWCGFIHHTPDTTYSNYNTAELFKTKEFIQSLHTCLALFTLSEPLSQYIRDRLKSLAPHVTVITFTHPVVDPCQTFSMKNYKTYKHRQLINIGAWMRNPFTLYRLDNIPIQKSILVGKEMSNYLPPENFKIEPFVNYHDHDNHPHPGPHHPCRTVEIGPQYPCRPEHTSRWVLSLQEWLISQGVEIYDYHDNTLYVKGEKLKGDEFATELNEKIQAMIMSVNKIDYQTNEEYDILLSKNIVFLDLVDAAAVNTIIECIIRKTPVIVNRLPGTIALLGEKYPLFYDNVDEISITDEKIERAHQYLKKLDNKRYKMNYFIDHMTKVIIKLDS